MQKHALKRTHGHDGKDRMVIVATLWDTGGRSLEESTMADSKKLFENEVHSYPDKAAGGVIDDLKDSRPYLAFVKKSLGGTPDKIAEVDDDLASGFKWYTRATGDGGYRILQVIPAVYGETEEQVKADPAAAAQRAVEHTAVADPVSQLMQTLMAAGIGGGGNPDLPGLFGDFDDDDGLFDDDGDED